jgi:hypothetical protein
MTHADTDLRDGSNRTASRWAEHLMATVAVHLSARIRVRNQVVGGITEQILDAWAE